MAIQVSRLNEALLVAFSAMGPTNLKAVDQVVKIVRELDRYHGFAAAQRRLPEPPRSEALVGGTATYGAALVCQARYEPQRLDDMDFDSVALPVGQGRLGAFAGDDRPENPTQSLEKVGSAPGNPGAPLSLSPLERGEGRGEGPGRWAAVGARPEDPTQSLEKTESAAGDSLAPRSPVKSPERERAGPAPPQATIARKILRKALKRLKSAPGDSLVPAIPGSRARGGRGLASELDPGAWATGRGRRSPGKPGATL